MIQINLVPDVKQDFLRAQRMQRLVITIATLVGGAFLALTVVMFLVVNVWQQAVINGNDDEIATALGEYQALEDVSEVLTVDNQLEELPMLHDDKIAITRLRPYLAKLIPNNVTLTKLTFDNELTTLIFEGNAPDIPDVNRFVDTLKNAVYYVNDPDFVDDPEIPNEIQTLPVFSSVVLEQVGKDSNAEDQDEQATFEIVGTYDAQIFDNSIEVVVIVPRTSSDALELIDPESLIDADILILQDRDQGRTEDLFEPAQPEGEEQ